VKDKRGLPREVLLVEGERWRRKQARLPMRGIGTRADVSGSEDAQGECPPNRGDAGRAEQDGACDAPQMVLGELERQPGAAGGADQRDASESEFVEGVLEPVCIGRAVRGRTRRPTLARLADRIGSVETVVRRPGVDLGLPA